MPGPDALTKTLNDQLDAIEDAMAEQRLADFPALSEQIWKYRRQLPEVLVDRLRSGRARIPVVAFEMLIGLAGARAPALLKRIAADDTVVDIVRWGARRRAGWAERGEAKARRAFLASLHDGAGTLVEAIAQAGTYGLPDCDILAEVLSYLRVLPTEECMSIMQRALEDDLPAMPWILRCLLHIGDPRPQTLSVEALMRLSDDASLGALSRLAQTSRDAELVEKADVALRRLQMRVVTPHSPPARRDSAEWPQLDLVRASAVDGSGSQLVVLTRRWDEVQGLFASIHLDDKRGIVDAWGIFRQPEPQVEDLTLALLGEDAVFVDIDLPAARAILAEAVQVAASTGQSLPPVFELWEPYFHDGLPPAPDEQVGVVDLDDSRYAGRRDLVRRSRKLFDHPMFASWFLNPEDLAPVLRAMGQPLISASVSNPLLIEKLFDATSRSLLRQRLRRQAWLLDRQGESSVRDMALAVAASLAETSQTDVGKHPFLQEMIDISLRGWFSPIGPGFF